MNLGFMFALFFFLKNTHGLSHPVGAPPTPPPSLPDLTEILRASQQNTNHVANIIASLQGTTAKLRNDIASTLNEIISATSVNRLGINRRTISDKLDTVGGPFTDTNSKSKSTQDSLNDVNGIVDSTRSLTNLVDENSDKMKGSTEDINRKIASIGTTSNDFLERIGSIKDNTNGITSRIDSIRSIVLDQDEKIDQIQRITDLLVALTNLII